MDLDQIKKELKKHKNKYISELESASVGSTSIIGKLNIIWVDIFGLYVFETEGDYSGTKYGQRVYGDSYGMYFDQVKISDLREVQEKTRIITYYE